MELSSKKVIEQLELKISHDKRIPSILKISAMLNDLGVQHFSCTSTNIVERSSGQNVYVNSRHNGKEGYKLEIKNVVYMDSSESYYSWNTRGYARDIINHLKSLGKI